MKKKEEYLNINNKIEIKSYNYEESNGFSQETAVDARYGKYKEHKFVINIEDEDYSLIFLNSHVVNKYAAMEDEWVEMENILRDDEVLKIKKLKKDYPYYSEEYVIEVLGEDIQEFKNKLIKSAKKIGIGCNYSDHINREDDFGITSYNIENSFPYSISDKVLFIEEKEIDFFEEYLSLETNEEEDFLNKIKDKIESKNQESDKKELKIIEEKGNIVNPLLQEYMKEITQLDFLECYMESKQTNSEYTVEEIQKEIDNLEKGDDIDYYHEKLSMLDELKKITVKINGIKNKILEHISQKEFEYSLKNSFEYIDFDPEEIYLDHHEEPEVETPYFKCEEEFLEYEYNKPRTIEERFKAIKIYIKNELPKDIIPSKLKDKFNIKDEITEFLNSKISKKLTDQKSKRINKIK